MRFDVTPVLAEVADKMPSLLSVWCLAGFLSFAAFAFALMGKWGALVGVAIACFSGFAVVQSFEATDLKSQIVRELGKNYVVSAYIAGFLPLLAAGLGIWCGGGRTPRQ